MFVLELRCVCVGVTLRWRAQLPAVCGGEGGPSWGGTVLWTAVSWDCKGDPVGMQDAEDEEGSVPVLVIKWHLCLFLGVQEGLQRSESKV